VATIHERQSNAGNEAAAQAVLDRLGHLALGEGMTHDRMVVFPLFAAKNGAGAQPGLQYRTLEQAIAEGLVQVTEQDSASVPELRIHNKGDVLVFILDGEEIVGGQQNRVVNTSFLIGAQTEMLLPVTCVEHGRWHSISSEFSSGEHSYYRLRASKHQQVTASLRSTGRPLTDQGEVWAEVADLEDTTGRHSDTGAMHQIFQSYSQDLSAYQAALPYAPGAVGMLVALGGQMAGADLFDQPGTAQSVWPRLLRSYALDALAGEPGEPVTAAQAQRFLDSTQGARSEVYPSVALGQEVRLEGDEVFGGGLVYQETPVHISLFRVQDAHRSLRSARARREAQTRLRRAPAELDEE
jgi:hypothetical protein